MVVTATSQLVTACVTAPLVGTPTQLATSACDTVPRLTSPTIVHGSACSNVLSAKIFSDKQSIIPVYLSVLTEPMPLTKTSVASRGAPIAPRPLSTMTLSARIPPTVVLTSVRFLCTGTQWLRSVWMYVPTPTTRTLRTTAATPVRLSVLPVTRPISVLPATLTTTSMRGHAWRAVRPSRLLLTLTRTEFAGRRRSARRGTML